MSSHLELLKAADSGDLARVKLLVEAGADIHAKDDRALRLASNYGHLEVVKYLVGCGANIHAWDDGALRGASRNGHLEVVEYLKHVVLMQDRKRKILEHLG